jgi:CheY-like chemotaxis protein
MRVLYVEDESLLAFAMEVAMEGEGYAVTLARDGEEGLAYAGKFQPDVIVTDYMMPEMDGVEMVRALRQQGITVPVIMTTAVPEQDFGPDARTTFDLYLGKPFSEETLLDALRRLTEGALVDG